MALETKALQRVAKLEIVTRRLVDGIVSGAYNSVFRGRGVEFDEIREYRYGDDVRAIDWNVTARLDRPYIKEFIEERDLQVYVIADVSGSGSFGSKSSKRSRIDEITAAILLAAQRSGDRAGLFLVTDRIEEFVPARRGKRHAMGALLKLTSCSPNSRKTHLAQCLGMIAKIVKRRSVIILVSDLVDDSKYDKPLRHLSARHDVMVFCVTDPNERNIPDVGLIELEDAETGEQMLVDTSDESFRQAYLDLVAKKDAATSFVMAQCKIDSIRLSTDADYESRLLNFFQARRRGGPIHGRL